MTTVALTGGGPGDGREIEIDPNTDTALLERRVGDGFFWMLLYCCDDQTATIYSELHPHDEMDFTPPAKLELWWSPKTPIKDL